jgi:hypothetical protein
MARIWPISLSMLDSTLSWWQVGARRVWIVVLSDLRDEDAVLVARQHGADAIQRLLQPAMVNIQRPPLVSTRSSTQRDWSLFS